MKKLTKYIIIVFIIIIILMLIILFLNNRKSEEDGQNMHEKINANEFEIQPEEELKEVESTDLVFNIRNCIQTYIDYINDNNYDAVLEVLDKNYVKNNNINRDNINQKSIEFLKRSIWIDKVYQKEITNEQRIYFVNGKMIDSNTYEDKGKLEFTVIVDDINQTFSIIPQITNDNNYNLKTKYDDENYYNEFMYKSYPDIEVFTEYFNYYKELAINRPEKAFDLLDKEYRKKRFNDNLEIYKEYLKDIDINNIYPDKISINFNEEYKEYVGIDKKGIYYIFNEISPMVFSLKLDTYTLVSDKFIETYNNGSEEEKVSMNIDKWLMMIKSKDYYNAYYILDETFRNNNFSDIENFKEYIKQNYCDNFTYSFGEIEKYNEIYTQIVNLNIDSQELRKNFVVKLLNDRQFILSFEV